MKAFQLSSYSLLFSGFISLFVTGGVGPILAVGYLLVVAWKAKREIWGRNLRPLNRKGPVESGGLDLTGGQQLILIILILIFFVVDLFTISGFVPATVHLLIFISLLKVFYSKREKDYLLLYFVSFSFLLLASTFTMSIVFLALLIVYVFFAILSFLLFESRRAYRGEPLRTLFAERVCAGGGGYYRLDQPGFRTLFRCHTAIFAGSFWEQAEGTRPQWFLRHTESG